MAHKEHDFKCQFCKGDAFCPGSDCLAELCRDCSRRLEQLQPAAKTMIEILMKRVGDLESRVNGIQQHG